MDINIYDFPCIGCKYATTGGMKIYCMKKGKKVNNLRQCKDFKEKNNIEKQKR